LNTRIPLLAALVSCAVLSSAPGSQSSSPDLSGFHLRSGGLELQRPTHPGAFFDVVGRRSVVLGYEHRGFEVWTYPLKILEDFELTFHIEGYPLDFRAADLAVQINVRPEATMFTYSHAAFTVRQIIFAPIDEPAIVQLLDVKTVLPMSITISFKPKLKLSWPAGLMTGNIAWDEKQHVYYLTEESNRYAGVIGSPAARDLSLMPYQEEPRDVPNRFVIEPSTGSLRSNFIPIVIAGSVVGGAAFFKTRDAVDRGSARCYTVMSVGSGTNFTGTTIAAPGRLGSADQVQSALAGCAALWRQGFLTRDSRVVERKKYGRAKARKSFQFSKR